MRKNDDKKKGTGYYFVERNRPVRGIVADRHNAKEICKENFLKHERWGHILPNDPP